MIAVYKEWILFLTESVKFAKNVISSINLGNIRVYKFFELMCDLDIDS